MRHLSELVEDKITRRLLARPLDPGRRNRGTHCVAEQLSVRHRTRKRGVTTKHKIRYETVYYNVHCPAGSGRIHEVTLSFIDIHKRPENRRVFIKCACEDFVFGGVQYHAKSENYLSGGLRAGSILAAPLIRDPQNRNKACKHVVAALRDELARESRRNVRWRS